jgi:hypothetical protein
LVAAYGLVFASGLAFWRLGPFQLRGDRWFLVAFLCFYLWVPIDFYTISLDIRFAMGFDPSRPVSRELKDLFMSRQMSLGPVPLLMLAGYVVGLDMAVFRPALGNGREGK